MRERKYVFVVIQSEEDSFEILGVYDNVEAAKIRSKNFQSSIEGGWRLVEITHPFGLMVQVVYHHELDLSVEIQKRELQDE